MIDVDRGLSEVTLMLRAAVFHAESDSIAVQRMRAHDLGHAARLLDELRHGPGVQLTVGENPIDAYSMHKNAYDFIEPRHETVEPNTVEQLRFRHNVAVNPYDRQAQPFFGRSSYFSLDAIGKTLRDGGALTIPE